MNVGSMKSALGRALVQTWLAVLILVLLWVLSRNSTSLFLPPFRLMVERMWELLQTDEMWDHIAFSMKNLFMGLALATVVGVSVGVLIGEQPRLSNAMMPFLDYCRSVPHISFVPIIIVTLGIGVEPKIFLIAFGCTWVILLNTVTGVLGVNPAVRETAKTYRIPSWLRLRRVVIQGALTSVMAGVRIALGIGITLMIVSEIYGSTEGLGFFILQSSQRFRILDTWAGTLLIGIIGYGLTMALVAGEYWFMAAHQERSRRRFARLPFKPKSSGEVIVSSSKVIRRHDDVQQLTVDSLTRNYGAGATEHRVLDNISVEVEPGEFVCIVGPSGAGKTTLLRCLSGLLAPTSGTVRYGDKEVTQPLDEIAVVFQDYRGSLMPWMRVRDNVAFPLQGRGVKKAERRRQADESLAAVGLPHVGDKYPWELSGGMQQRVAIARALAYSSPILLMDEPFGSVDAQARFELEDLVLELRRNLGITVVLVTHDIDESVYLGDRVIVLGGSPATVIDTIPIELGPTREQITTREMAEFTHLRTRVLKKIRASSAQPDAAAPAERSPGPGPETKVGTKSDAGTESVRSTVSHA